MSLSIVGKKLGMTRIFTEEGASTPITVLQVEPNRITQVKTEQSDGYSAIQVTTGERRANRVTGAMKGHYAAAKVEPGRALWEFRLDDDEGEYAAGGELTVSMFSEGQYVDVRGTSIGKGFAGVMKRHGFRGGRATHGNSKAHRKPGSIGQNQDPGRVFPGKKMAGQMGNVARTQQNLQVVRVDAEKNLLLIKGSLPGSKGRDVIIKASVKADAPAATAGK